MDRLIFLALSSIFLSCLAQTTQNKGETILSTLLTPEAKEKTLKRQGRSYYDQRYGRPYPPPSYYGVRPLYERLEYRPDYDRPSRCGRCNDDRYDDRDRDSDRDRDRDRDDDRSSRDRYDDDRRGGHRPTYGNRLDKNDDDRYDRKGGSNNGTNDDNDNDKKGYDDKDNRPSGSKRGGSRDRNRHDDRDRDRDRDRYRPDDRDRYRPDYYDRFLRDPYRDYERPYYDDPYRERRPLFDRYPYDEAYAGRYDGYGYPGYRRPTYEDRYDRGNGYDDAFGGYGPGVGRSPHDSFRPWDETYRGQAGWDAGGRGYYFASGRPEPASSAAWARPEYARPQTSSGWQNVGYSGGYQNPLPEYQSSFGGYQSDGYRRGAGTGYSTGWLSVGERRPYRDQSGVNGLDSRERYGGSSRYDNRYDGQADSNRQSGYGQSNSYGQTNRYGQTNGYGQSSNFGQSTNLGQSSTYGQASQSTGTSSYSSSTTPQTSYLYEREDDHSSTKTETTTKPPS